MLVVSSAARGTLVGRYGNETVQIWSEGSVFLILFDNDESLGVGGINRIGICSS